MDRRCNGKNVDWRREWRDKKIGKQALEDNLGKIKLSSGRESTKMILLEYSQSSVVSIRLPPYCWSG